MGAPGQGQVEAGDGVGGVAVHERVEHPQRPHVRVVEHVVGRAGEFGEQHRARAVENQCRACGGHEIQQWRPVTGRAQVGQRGRQVPGGVQPARRAQVQRTDPVAAEAVGLGAEVRAQHRVIAEPQFGAAGRADEREAEPVQLVEAVACAAAHEVVGQLLGERRGHAGDGEELAQGGGQAVQEFGAQIVHHRVRQPGRQHREFVAVRGQVHGRDTDQRGPAAGQLGQRRPTRLVEGDAVLGAKPADLLRGEGQFGRAQPGQPGL
ncbi:hypothetical protein CJ468_06212 [Nocardia farcinica]|nr:hypothetical protein CJ468_06212 [Nocardia farcinica]